LTGIRPGRTTIQAEFDGVVAKDPLNAEVTAAADFDEVRVLPTPASILPGETIVLAAKGFKGGKDSGTITNLNGLSWKSSDGRVARSEGPAVTGLQPGKSEVSAQLGSMTGRPAEVRVVTSLTDRLKAEPAVIRMHVGEACRIGDGVALLRGNLDLSRQCSASPMTPGVVRYDPALHALVGVAPGISPVSFSHGDQVATASVEVVAAPSGQAGEGEVVIEPVSAKLSPGQAADLRVFLVTKSGDRIDRTGDATFHSSDEGKATMSGTWACAMAPGMSEITASLAEAKTPGRAYVTVDNEPITALIVEPARLNLGVGDLARLEVLGRSASGTHELFPQDKLKISVGGANPQAVKLIGSQHVDAVAPGSAEINVAWNEQFRQQVAVSVTNDPWTGLALEPATATIHPGQRLTYMVTGVRGGQRRVIWPQDGMKLSTSDPAVGEVVDETFVHSVNPGKTDVIAQLGSQQARATLTVTPGIGAEGVLVDSLNPGIYVTDRDGTVYVGGRGGSVTAIGDAGTTIVEPEGSKFIPLPAAAIQPGEATARFQEIKAGISDQIVPDFVLNFEIQAEGANPLEYRAYVPGQAPPETWVPSKTDGDGQRVVLDSPRIKNTGKLSSWYDMVLEARDPRDGTVQQHPLRFRLPQNVTIEQKEKPADDLLPNKPKADDEPPAKPKADGEPMTKPKADGEPTAKPKDDGEPMTEEKTDGKPPAEGK
jgi:hypothetical protein